MCTMMQSTLDAIIRAIQELGPPFAFGFPDIWQEPVFWGTGSYP
jgi:hypothetical protein